MGIIIALWQVSMLKTEIRLTVFNSVLEQWEAKRKGKPVGT
jgi:hypothetical protein